MKTDAAVALLIVLIERAAEISALINKARAEKRDITDAELDALAAGDDQARALLDAEIARARQREAGQPPA